MILRRIGIALLLLLGVIVAFWIAALKFLPDAPGAFGRFTRSVRGEPAAVETAGVLAVPIAGIDRTAIRDSWGDPRDNGLRAHHGTDIAAPAGTPVRAAAPGRVEKLWNSAAGGTTAYVRSPDGRWIYYYAHLAGYAAGVHEGQAIRAGEPIGFVGDTGNAGAGNFHLHFGLARTTPAQKWYQGQDIDPYPYLAGKPLPR